MENPFMLSAMGGRNATQKAWVALLTLFALSLPASRARGIPVFARLYGESCTTCHVAVPKLNTTGRVFRANGYQFPGLGDESLREKPVPLGGPATRRMWPRRAVWPGELPGSVPLAVRLMLDMRLNPNSEIRYDFRAPHELELLSAGTLGKSLSFFVEYAAVEDGAPGSLERAFLQFNRLRGTKLLHVRVGQIEPIVVPFSRYRKLTMAAYPTSAVRSGPSEFRFHDPQRGVEVWGLRDGSRGGGALYGLGVVNGNGIGGLSPGGALDNNSAKDVYARLAVKLGGMSVSGENAPPPEGAPWVDNSITIGGSAYRGWPGTGPFWRYGGDVRVRLSGLDLFGAVLAGTDDVAGSDSPGFRSWFVEADQVVLPWLIAIARYGEVDGWGQGAAADSREALVAINASVRPNLIVRFETVSDLRGRLDHARVRLDVVY